MNVKLTRAELAAIDEMVEVLENEGSPLDKRVALRRVARPFPTTIARVLRITTSKHTLAEDVKTLAQIEKLTAKVKSKMSIKDLLELRRSATAPRR